WYPDQGGNLSLTVGGDLTGDVLSQAALRSSSSASNWLWRQGAGVDGTTPAAWWINFGTFVAEEQSMQLAGFTGLGTLGGGNLVVDVAGNAGMLAPRGNIDVNAERSQGLVLAIGSTGRMVDGALQ
ncbi:hypothetical protein, partial [Pseudomonas viridiflava]|uniref:hypothetical protein n=1 Tax=Pseudomonas viridiflava TaxID=33069 RepID=UPI0013CE5659